MGSVQSELESLKHASFMGSITRKEDLLFILEAIRGRSSRPRDHS